MLQRRLSELLTKSVFQERLDTHWQHVVQKQASALNVFPLKPGAWSMGAWLVFIIHMQRVPRHTSAALRPNSPGVRDRGCSGPAARLSRAACLQLQRLLGLLHG